MDGALSYAEAARYLSLSVPTVRRLCAAGELPRCYIGPTRRTPRIEATALAAYLERTREGGGRTEAATAAPVWDGPREGWWRAGNETRQGHRVSA